jgi:hypothetical protein
MNPQIDFSPTLGSEGIIYDVMLAPVVSSLWLGYERI